VVGGRLGGPAGVSQLQIQQNLNEGLKPKHRQNTDRALDQLNKRY
jgi:hypothetical protein